MSKHICQIEFHHQLSPYDKFTSAYTVYSKSGKKTTRWRYLSIHDYDLPNCLGRTITEEKLKEVYMKVFNKIIQVGRKFQCQLQNNFSKAINQVNEEQLNKFDRELDRLQIILINKSPNSP